MARETRLNIRMTDAERATVHAAAVSAGVSDSECARGILLGHIAEQRIVGVDAGMLDYAVRELKAVGNNLNQLVRLAHANARAGRELPRESIDEALSGLRVTLVMVEAVVSSARPSQ